MSRIIKLLLLGRSIEWNIPEFAYVAAMESFMSVRIIPKLAPIA
ncbi:MAG TPA: hypothetical protein VLF69_06270 [Candidatus Saccharimonadales bacterium]|nr:hypothetical protein [Candidatus Saccharimonadales bacterium]